MPIIFTDKPLPERSEADLYVTPQDVINIAMEKFGRRDAKHILDIGANDGRWGLSAENYADSPVCLVGVDIRPLPKPDKFTFWQLMDYGKPIECALMPVKSFDFIVSNPPFYCAEAIVRNAWQQLKNGGSMLFLLPDGFWYSSGRFKGLWRDIPLMERASIVRRIPFTGGGNPNLYDLYYWRKGKDGSSMGIPNECRNTQILF